LRDQAEHRDVHQRIDPELQASLEAMLALSGGQALSLRDIPAARAAMAQMVAGAKALLPAVDGVASEDRLVRGKAGDPAVKVRIYRPAAEKGPLPALLWIHGGAYVLGDVEQDDHLAGRLALAAGCAVISVDYRLAPEHPFPAPLDDCYAALEWISDMAGEIGIDGSRIAIGGASAGGGLCAGLALLARDRGEIDVIFQLLIYPMIDDRNTKPDAALESRFVTFNLEACLIGWRSYLGCEPGEGDVSTYAAAFRAADLHGLPPAYVAACDLDILARENLTYALRLVEADVPTELHLYPGTYHGFDVFAADAAVSRRFVADRDRALRRALHGA
jgi:acetyl esterase/lipase